MELDHFFVFTPLCGGSLRARLAALGLTETYQRVHPGQATANVCFVFDDAYLELLWLTSLSLDLWLLQVESSVAVVEGHGSCTTSCGTLTPHIEIL